MWFLLISYLCCLQMSIIEIRAHASTAFWFGFAIFIVILWSLSISHLNVTIAHLGALYLLSLTHIWNRCKCRLVSFRCYRSSRGLSSTRVNVSLIFIHIIQAILIVEDPRRTFSGVHGSIGRSSLSTTRTLYFGLSDYHSIWIDFVFHFLSRNVLLIDYLAGSFVIETFLLEYLGNRHLILTDFWASFLSFLWNNFNWLITGWLVWVIWVLQTLNIINGYFPLRNYMADWVFAARGLNTTSDLPIIVAELMLRVLVDLWILNEPNLVVMRYSISAPRSHIELLVFSRVLFVLLN
jgi:hypothetical protein